MKRQVQVEESKRLITEAFASLLERKSYERITLANIAEEAGVSRMTIHRHFKQKEDILLYKVKKVMDDLNSNTFKAEAHTLEDDLVNRFRTLSKMPRAKLLLHSEKLSSIIYDVKSQSNLDAANHYFKNINDKYVIQFILGGMSFMVKEWLANDCEESPEEMTKKILKILESLSK